MASTVPILHQGRSLTLRRVMLEDTSLLFEKMYCNLEFMSLMRLNDTIKTEEQLRERIAYRLQVPPAESGMVECLILHKKYGAIGIAIASGYTPLHRRAEIALGLFDESTRHASYGAEGLCLLLDLLFNAYDLHRVYAYVYSHNHLSQRSLRATGLNEEGVMQDHLFDQATQQFINLHIFGMTVDQFRQNQCIKKHSPRLVGRDITQPLSIPLAPPNECSPVTFEASSKPNFIKSGVLSHSTNGLTLHLSSEHS